MTTQTFEVVSPFVDAVPDELPLSDLLSAQRPSLFKELLTDSSAIAARMLEPRKAQETMVHTLALLLVATAASGFTFASLAGTGLLRATLLLPISIILAVAAAMGPVAATALMSGARMPWPLLAAALTASVTAGCVTLVALLPVSVVAMRIDSQWAGPLSIVGAFVIAGLISGRKIRSMLDALAGQVGGALSDEAKNRIGLVGRVALVQLSFTLSISLWGLEVFK